MLRLRRKKNPLLGKPSRLLQWWNRQGQERRKRIVGTYYAISAHCLLISVLYAVGLAAPTAMQAISFEADIADTPAAQTVRFDAIAESPEFTLDPPAHLVSAPEFEPEQLIDVAIERADHRHVTPDEQPLSDTPLQVADQVLDGLTTDSERIAEVDRRVAAAGGNLLGAVRISLIFSGTDDLDLHVEYKTPGLRQGFGLRGPHIFKIDFTRKRTPHGELDVDANAQHIMNEPCENVVFRSLPRNTVVNIGVHHYRDRDSDPRPLPFILVVKQHGKERVFTGQIARSDGLKIVHSLRFRR